MSDLRVALIAEGPTDAIVIEAALRALLPRPFILSRLQPEPTSPRLGTGWGGVLRWCLDFARRGHVSFEEDPMLPGFDLFVVHVDADVADGAYGDVSDEIVSVAAERSWPVLPNSVPCPPPTRSADAVRACILAWAGLQTPGPKTVLCVPSKAVDAWLVAAVFDSGHRLLTELECNRNVAGQLEALPAGQRIRKAQREYSTREKAVTKNWSAVRQRCSQAERFSADVAAVAV
jgi:hypothetical protein